MSRGGKEGNNAFTHDSKMRKELSNSEPVKKKQIIRAQPNLKMLKILTTYAKDQFSEEDFRENIFIFARAGNFEVCRKLVKECGTGWGMGMNRLHAAALTDDDKVGFVRKSTATKNTYGNKGITPMHLASINPNPMMLRKYFKVSPTTQVQDEDMRDLTHYAAAAHTSAALEFFIQKK